ncbi:hypothetical protein [Granulicella sp. dw_53]|uniref:hypothetical protein n=1 Tax=Granulicella sp. dw_53 TaxID=2719792 RepID=UPI001BD292A6|nr:hypothetical protein [Granulicella sp. dw_53]
MTPAYDPIPELRKLGYTEREAAFLYLVGIHSGYFLRRQFLGFIERKDGAMAQRFLQKSIGVGHVHAIEYAAGRHIYHLRSKLIYRVLEMEDSQNRRIKGDRQIKARLMQVDYLTVHFGEQFLETTQQKVIFFQEKLKLPVESLPQVSYGSKSATCYFPDRFPLAVSQEPNEPHPTITLTFLDDGLRSLSAFLRWLEQYTPLLRSLHHVEVVYAADNSRNFADAERKFLQQFPKRVATKELPRGVEHFLSYLEVRTRYDQQSGGYSADQVRILRDGMNLYTSLEHQALLSAWKMGSTAEAKIRARFEPQTNRASIQCYLLEYDYPVWSMKYRRAVL